ncbi:MAG TPA: hypothetical protein VEN29_20715 [Casimicrobiaceae bacterium]|nr:hypothetical protein [Casimicrobiaceae bacterium]
MTNVEHRSTPPSVERAARLLFCASALGEIGVGAGALVFPQIIAFLLAAPLDPGGLLLARMLGSAALALGITWWIARNEPVRQLSSRFIAGYLVYNLGVGLLFLFRALSAEAPAWPWVVAIVHILAGVGFAAAVFVTRRTSEAKS